MRRLWKKSLALFLTMAMLVTSLGVMTVFASGQEAANEPAVPADQVKKPTASVKPGAYEKAQKVKLVTETKDAVIYYTLDGKTPTEKSTKYEEKKPIEVKKTTTIMAIAVKKDMKDSEVAKLVYGIGAEAVKAAAAAKATETPAAGETAKATETPAAGETAKASVTPAVSEAAKAPEETPEAEAADDPKTADEPAETADEPVSVAVDLAEDKEIVIGKTPAADLNNKDNYKLSGGEQQGYTLSSVSWGTYSALNAGQSYTVTVEINAAVDASISQLLFMGKELSPAPLSGTVHRFSGTYEVPSMTLSPVAAPAPDAENLISAGSTVNLSLDNSESGETEIVYAIGADESAAYKLYEEKGITVTADADANFVLRTGVKQSVFVYPAETLTYALRPGQPAADPQPGTYKKDTTVKLQKAEADKPFSDKAEYQIYYTTVEGDQKAAEAVSIDPDKDPEYDDSKGISLKIPGTDKKETWTIKAVAVYSVTVDGQPVERTSDPMYATYTMEDPSSKPAVTTKKIQNVKVEDLESPKRGARPDTTATATADSHARVTSVTWTEGTSKNPNGPSVTGGVFKAGTEYFVHISLKADSGYAFDTTVFKAGRNSSAAKISNYGSNPNVASVSADNLELIAGWRTAAAATASADNNTITGLKSSYTKGSTVTFTMTGAGGSNTEMEGNERYVPIRYKISSNEYAAQASGTSENDYKTSVTKSVRINAAGNYPLTVTFQKQVYSAESGRWENAAGQTATKTDTIRVTSSASTSPTRSATGTSSSSGNSSDSSTSSSASNADTADETPLGMWMALFALAGLAAVTLTVYRRKSR